MKRSALAAQLLAVRDGAALIDEVPVAIRPADLVTAYAIADELVAALEPRLGSVAGYKVGATSPEGQRLLGLAEPFYGRAFANCILRGDSVSITATRSCTVEAEIGFVLGRDLPPRSAAYSLAEVGAAIDLIAPLFEINRPSYARPFAVGGLCLVADNGVTRAFVVGAFAAVRRGAPDPARETVRLLRNGEACAEGRADAVLGNPTNALMWLANALRLQGRGLRAGDVVASGALTPPIAMTHGDTFAAEYATLGRLALTVAGSALQSYEAQ